MRSIVASAIAATHLQAPGGVSAVRAVQRRDQLVPARHVPVGQRIRFVLVVRALVRGADLGLDLLVLALRSFFLVRLRLRGRLLLAPAALAAAAAAPPPLRRLAPTLLPRGDFRGPVLLR